MTFHFMVWQCVTQIGKTLNFKGLVEAQKSSILSDDGYLIYLLHTSVFNISQFPSTYCETKNKNTNKLDEKTDVLAKTSWHER